MDTLPAPPRRQYSDRYGRQVVTETRHGTESVSEVARRHDLNTSLVFKWRQRYPELAPTPISADAALPADGSPGRIAIILRGGHRLNLEGAVDPTLVRVVLGSLR